MAGIEMGFWNFLATSLQAIGLEQTTAVRSAFIIQVGSGSSVLGDASFSHPAKVHSLPI